MIIKPIASGSGGNCYLISVADTSILIECGISFKRIQTALWGMGYMLADISACLISHEHGDHVKSAQALADSGMDIYTSGGTIAAAGLKGHRIHELPPMMGILIKDLYIYPYLVEHDAAMPYAFSVACRDTQERLLFITDTMFFKYNVSGITHLMIEANYDPEIIAQNAESGRINQLRAKRTITTHMSLNTAKLTVEKMDKSKLREIWLLHLSNDNAITAKFKKEIQKISGVPVYVA